MPKGIKQAVIGVWITIGLSVTATLINKWIGAISENEFFGQIIFYSLFCIFPYKLNNGSNPARWIYAVLIAVSLLFMLGGVAGEIPKLDLVVSVLLIPIEIFILIKLFQPEATKWFSEPK